MCNGKVWNSAFRHPLYHHVNARSRGMATKTDGMLPSDSSGGFYGCGFPTISPHSLRSQAFRTGRVWGCGWRGGGFHESHPFRVGKTEREFLFGNLVFYLILFYNLLVMDLFGKIKSGFSLFIDLFI